MFDVDQLKRSMQALIRDYPDLAEDDVLRADMLEGATTMNEVLARLFDATNNDKFMVGAITARINQLTERRARIVHRIEYLRNLILSIMQAGNLKKLELPEATLIQRQGVPQIVGLVDAASLPDDLCKITREASKTKIREALEAGRDIPGISLGNAPPSLQINAR